jgi:ferredoxin-type protein NapG
MQLAKGLLGRHYRLGWEEKEKAGKSLVTPDEQHHYNLPQGYGYDYEGQGLIEEGEDGDTPYSSSPLETLKRRAREQQ